MPKNKKQKLSDYKLIIEHDKDSDKNLEDIMHSDEFKKIVRKIILGSDIRGKNTDMIK